MPDTPAQTSKGIPIISAQEAISRQKNRRFAWWDDYLAMYSSIFQGIVTQPWLMGLPIDDHMVHRGDWVFDFCR